MAKLYEIDQAIENFDYQFDEETGEMINAMELDALEMERKEKIEGICLYIKNLTSDIDAYKNEIKSFQEKAKRVEKKIQGMKDYLNYSLGGEKFHTDLIDITYRKSTAVEITGILDEEYQVAKTTYTPDKDKIKKAIQSGVEVLGAELVERQNMQIK